MRAVRIAFVTLIALYGLTAFVTTLATFRQPVAEYGYTVALDGVTIASAEPGLPAARAGIEPGDTLSYASLSPAGRLNALAGQFVPPGTPMQLEIVHRGRPRTVTLTPVELPSLYAATNLAFAIAGLALAAVSLVLVLLRPSRMTWGFALIPLPVLLPDALALWDMQAPRTLALCSELFASAIYALQFAGIMIFASRFPDDAPRGPNRFIDRLAVPFGVAAMAAYAYVTFDVFFATRPPPQWLLLAQDYVAPTIPSVAALAALVTTYVLSRRSLRSRLAPALLAFVLVIVTGAATQYVAVATSNPAVILFVYFVFPLSTVLLAVAVAYAVVRHRVIDVSFIVGRTLVYSTLTIFAVGVFTLIEFFVGRVLEHNGLAIVLEILAALALGLSLNALHGRLDRFIDVVLFRRRHLAEARLQRVAASLPHAVSRQLVEEMLVEEPADALDLASAAVFVADESERRYVRTMARGWAPGNASELDADDHLVVRLRAELRPTKLDDLRWPRTDIPVATAQPLYAVPIPIGRRLEAIALYGGHSGGEDLDPDERRALRALAASAMLAYDHLRATALKESLERARHENDALRKVERTLTDLLKERLHDSGETA